MRRDPSSSILTVTNPTAAGISYPPALLSSLDSPRGREYRPEPLGEPEARAAVAATYATAREQVTADDVVLTASTSEAYSLLFKLLTDPGDAVLVPQPSYPLFDLLGRLEGVVSRPYRLDYHGAWSIDRDSVERGLTSDVRAVLLVNPNNPTGSMLRADDREWIVTLARARGVALVSDEVFADYPLRRRPDATSLVGETRALTFVLGGLSKSAGLPQVKLGWIVVGGPAPERADAFARLEMICDTYLSVSTPVQLAALDLIDKGRVIRTKIAERLARNLQALDEAVAAYPPVSLLEPEGGWSAVLRVPATAPEESLVLKLLEADHVVVHPGYFFDFADEAFLVVSLLTEPAAFDEGLRRVLRRSVGEVA